VPPRRTLPTLRVYGKHVSSTWDDGACLLEALRDRTRGRFHHTSTEVEDGVFTTNYTFLLGSDDKVLMLRTYFDGSVSVRDYLPVWSCTLKSYDALDACVAAGTDPSGSNVCDTTEDWFEACEAIENPECPRE
jgi:hypothetical protein